MSITRRRLRALLVVLVLAAAVVIAPVSPTPAQAMIGVKMQTIDVPAVVDGQSYSATGWSVATPIRTDPFALVGVELPDEREVQIRTAAGDGGWSEWTELPHQHDEGPDPGSREGQEADPGHRTHPVYTGAADRLQVRSAAPDAIGLKAYLIDPFGLDRSWAQKAAAGFTAAWRGTPRSVAGSVTDMPQIVTREQWAADESIVREGPYYAPDVDRGFVHHTVGPNDYTLKEAPGIVRAVMEYHVNANGWADIGYNFLVDRFGTIYEGRAGGMDRAVIGAQAGGFNTGSTGVALMGTYTDTTPEPVMVEALTQVLAWKADVHHFDPTQTGQATSAGSTRYGEGEVVTLNNISGHRDVSATTCPGDGTYALLPEIRVKTRALAGDLIVNHADDLDATPVIDGMPLADGVTITAELDPPGTWTIVLVDPEGAVVQQASGKGEAAAMTVDFSADTWSLGDYQWTVESPGRRSAVGGFAFKLPTIDHLSALVAAVEADDSGTLVAPVRITAELWDSAHWEVLVTDPQGTLVFGEQGSGANLDVEWAEGATQDGVYTVDVTAEPAEPARTTLQVGVDRIERLGGSEDPVGGAVLVSEATFEPRTAAHAVIARHDVFADALAGGPLAGAGGPLLLTAGDELDDRVAVELDRVLADQAVVYVLGGSKAISDELFDQLEQGDFKVVRVSGGGRVATAAAVAGLVVERSGATTAMIARAGPDDQAPWADALSGGAYGAYAGVPVLLSESDRLSAETAAALETLDITDTVVLGGTAAISQTAMNALPDPVRLAGDERTGTAVAVAERLWPSAVGAGQIDAVLLGNGYGDTAWGYALASAPVSAMRQAPLLITSPDTLSPSTAAYLDDADQPIDLTVVGPESLVSPEVGSAAGKLLDQ